MNFLSKVSNVRKLVAAVVGLALMVAAPFVPGVSEAAVFGLPQESVVQMVLAVLTAAGVYQAANTPTEVK